jgi:hypothetical protein
VSAGGRAKGQTVLSVREGHAGGGVRYLFVKGGGRGPGGRSFSLSASAFDVHGRRKDRGSGETVDRVVIGIDWRLPEVSRTLPSPFLTHLTCTRTSLRIFFRDMHVHSWSPLCIALALRISMPRSFASPSVAPAAALPPHTAVHTYVLDAFRTTASLCILPGRMRQCPACVYLTRSNDSVSLSQLGGTAADNLMPPRQRGGGAREAVSRNAACSTRCASVSTAPALKTYCKIHLHCYAGS